MERRLAAILAADVVGYSRLMGVDEAATLAAIKAHRLEVIDPKAAQYNGRTIKLMGDGALMEFPSVVDAVTFAVEVQVAIRGLNADLPEDERVLYRVGINIGDIIVEDDDIFGDGVNVAARLEGLAEPGGICVRRNVRNQVRDKLDLDFDELGAIAVKNIARPVRAFRVVLNEKAEAMVTPVMQAVTSTGRRRWPMAAAVVAALLLVMGGGFAVWKTGQTPSAEVIDSSPAVRAPAEASIIVLPIDDLSGDASLGYFADGMTEDVITELARWRDIRVVARNSALKYKGKPVDVRDVAGEMGVRYVLEGSVRRSGDKIRISAQLIDGTTGHHVWAERFDEAGTDVLALQDRVTDRIVATLGGNQGVIREDEYHQAWSKADVDLDEYDYYLRGHDLFYRYTPKDNARAIAIWEEGLAKYPDSGLLKVKLGWGHHIAGRYAWVDDPQAALASAHRLVEEGLADPDLPAAGYRFGLWLRSTSNIYYKRDYEAAVRDAKTAVASFPYDTETLFWMSRNAAMAGEIDLADEWIETALDRDVRPHPRYFGVVGRLRFAQGRYEEAIAAFMKMRPNAERICYLAASHAALGDMAKARAYAKELLEKFPDMTPDFVRGLSPFRDQAVPDRLLAQLAVAGWPQ